MNVKFSLLLLFLMGILLFSSLFLNVRFLLSSRASSGALENVSAVNSYLFASPTQAKADNSDVIRVTVYVLNGQGKGVTGIPVSLVVPASVGVKPVQPVSDNYGKATFDLTTRNSGTYTVAANAEAKSLGESISVSFN